jgi:hypothetical protein
MIPSWQARHQQQRRTRTTEATVTTTNPPTALAALSFPIDVPGIVTETLFQPQVPLPESFVLNGILFALLRTKLLKVLTPEGFVHALFLGTMLWTTLGWKGWTLCVLYLVLGSAVTKVKFREKEKLGIAEGRGGRRGPENVWCVQ